MVLRSRGGAEDLRTRSECLGEVKRWNLGEVRELIVDGEAVTRLTLIDHEIRIGSSVVKMGGLARLATKTEHRMKGYARTLMNDSIAEMQKRGSDVSMLFGIPNLYHKFGFAPCLADHKATLNTHDALEAAKTYQVREFRATDTRSVLEIYNAVNRYRNCTVLRPESRWHGFERGSKGTEGPSPRAVVAEDPSGDPVAYASFDTLREEFNVLESGALSRDGYEALLREGAEWAQSSGVASFSVFAPPDHPVAEVCQRFGCRFTSIYLRDSGGMMRIVNLDSLLQKLKGEFERRISISHRTVSGRLEVRTDIGRAIVGVRGGEVRIDPAHECAGMLELPQHTLAQLLVGYRSLEDALDTGTARLTGAVDLTQALFARSTPYMYVEDTF